MIYFLVLRCLISETKWQTAFGPATPILEANPQPLWRRTSIVSPESSGVATGRPMEPKMFSTLFLHLLLFALKSIRLRQFCSFFLKSGSTGFKSVDRTDLEILLQFSSVYGVYLSIRSNSSIRISRNIFIFWETRSLARILKFCTAIFNKMR